MGQVWTVSMVKDEQDVVGSMLAQLVDEGVDGIVVADNMSSDGTRAILDDFATRQTIPVIVVDDLDPGYGQSVKMSRLAELAHYHGADWIVPVDADECWYGRDDRLAVYLRSLPDDIDLVPARLYNHFRTALDLEDPEPFRSMVFCNPEPASLPKVACRYRGGLVIEAGNHGAHYLGHAEQTLPYSTLEIRHFPYRSPEQFVRKARNGGRALAATDLPEYIGAHWRQYNALIERIGEEQFIAEVWERYYYNVSPTDGGLVYDPAPYLRWPPPSELS